MGRVVGGPEGNRDMTEQEIDKLEPGDATDALVAEHVMKFDRVGVYQLSRVSFKTFSGEIHRIDEWLPLFDWPGWGKNFFDIERSDETELRHYSGGRIIGVLRYSTDIEAAWEIVGKLKNLGFGVSVDDFRI
jgi:hypothetical protein